VAAALASILVEGSESLLASPLAESDWESTPALASAWLSSRAEIAVSELLLPENLVQVVHLQV
jgi:hypothetical protein